MKNILQIIPLSSVSNVNRLLTRIETLMNNGKIKNVSTNIRQQYYKTKTSLLNKAKKELDKGNYE
jgi:hypothetical protein